MDVGIVKTNQRRRGVWTLCRLTPAGFSMALGLIIGMTASCGAADTQSPEELEYELKAAFVFNFMRFIEWPKEKNTANRGYDRNAPSEPAEESTEESLPPLIVGVVGKNPFGRAFDPIIERQLQGRSIVVITVEEMARYRGNEDGYCKKYAELLKRCDMVFLCASEGPYVERLLEIIAGSAVVTVSDIPDFTQRGGMIGFVMEKQRVRFDVHLGHVKKESITIRSQLLELARRVHKR